MISKFKTLAATGLALTAGAFIANAQFGPQQYNGNIAGLAVYGDLFDNANVWFDGIGGADFQINVWGSSAYVISLGESYADPGRAGTASGYVKTAPCRLYVDYDGKVTGGGEAWLEDATFVAGSGADPLATLSYTVTGNIKVTQTAKGVSSSVTLTLKASGTSVAGWAPATMTLKITGPVRTRLNGAAYQALFAETITGTFSCKAFTDVKKINDRNDWDLDLSPANVGGGTQFEIAPGGIALTFVPYPTREFTTIWNWNPQAPSGKVNSGLMQILPTWALAVNGPTYIAPFKTTPWNLGYVTGTIPLFGNYTINAKGQGGLSGVNLTSSGRSAWVPNAVAPAFGTYAFVPKKGTLKIFGTSASGTW